MMAKVFVVGSANTDFIVQVPRLPTRGETVMGGSFHTAGGGKGANQAVAAARMGGEVTFVCRLGSDQLGDEAIEAYRKEGISTDYIKRDSKTASGVALILVDQTGSNIIAVAPGANQQLTPDDVYAAEAVAKEADIFLVQLEIPLETVIATCQLASRHHLPVILNPAPAIEFPPELYGLVTYLTPNEKETAVLSGSTKGLENRQLLPDLARRAGVENIVITRGDKGARVYTHGIVTDVKPFRVTPVDTTACGDAFNGALAVAIGSGHALPEAVRFANAAGALAATKLGAQPSLPNTHEVDEFIASLIRTPN